MPLSSHASPYPLYSRADSDERGRHLVARCAIPQGRLIFAERPLVALQSLDNQQDVKICHCCKAFIGGPDYALVKRFEGVPQPDHVDADDALEGALEAASAATTHNTTRPTSTDDAAVSSEAEDFTVIPCRHACGHNYCSKECEADAWQGFHQDLCTGLCTSADDPIVQFKIYAAETNEILLMVAEWWVAQHRCLDEFRQRQYTDFSMPYWWDVAVTSSMDQIGGFAEGALIQESLKQICAQAADLLNRALVGKGIPFITDQDVSRWIGACEQNSMGIRQRHALCRSVLEDSDLRERRHTEIVRCLAEAGFIGDDNDEGEEDEEEKEEHDEDRGNDNNDESAENENEEEAVEDRADEVEEGKVEQKDLENYSQSGKENDEWDYSVEDIEKYLAGLFIDEDSSVRDAAVADPRFRDTVGDDLDYIFSPLDGTAMYYTACKMNHSCAPNVIVLYKGRGWGRKHPLTAYCIAYKDIEEGEELTISYIENDDPLEKRQKDLANYGFVCNCSKCLAQKNGETQDEDKTTLVGDVDDIFGGEDDEEDQVSDKQDDEQLLSLEQKVERLDSVVNHSRFGNVSPSLQGKVAAFVLQTGKDSADVEDKAVLDLWHYCRSGMLEKDFCLCKIGGSDLEALLYQTLRNSSWTVTSYRTLYWCAGLSAALGLAHEGSFIDALRYLDKTMILGLARHHELLFEFFDYVEQHAGALAHGPYNLRSRHAVPELSSIESRNYVQAVGLPRPIVRRVPEQSGDLEWEEISGVSKGVPFVLRGFASKWRSVEEWRSISFFGAEHGHRLVPIEVGSMLGGKMEEKIVTLRRFIDEYLVQSLEKSCWSLQNATDSTDGVAYMAQHPLTDQIPSLKSALDPEPSLCGQGGPSHVYFWFGTGGTRTPLHWDSYDNLFVQVVGAKYVRLYKPSERAKLYVNKSGYGLQGNMSDIDCENEDFTRHPLAEKAVFQEVVLYPGDALYIPNRTWHYVRSITTSISLNYWF